MVLVPGIAIQHTAIHTYLVLSTRVLRVLVRTRTRVRVLYLFTGIIINYYNYYFY